MNEGGKKKKNRICTITSSFIFLLISIIYVFPLFINIENWGRMDWDQFTFWNAVPREVILRYHQFPLWNPYSNGGNVLLAHPHSSFLTPFYISILIFGPIVGLKLQITIHLLIGMLGMFFLSKYFNINKHVTYLPPLVYMLSSVYALHLIEGHIEWLPMAFVPWLFLFYFKSLQNIKYIIGCIAYFVLMLLGGSVYIFSIIITLFLITAFFSMLQQKKFTPLKLAVIVITATFLICCIKLMPMLEFIRDNPRKTELNDFTDISLLPVILLSRQQAFYYQNTNMIQIQHGWHEYGAYVGVLPLILAVIGLISRSKKYWPLLVTGILSLWISMGKGFFYSFWGLLHKFPIYNSLHVPSRFILGFIFFLSIFSGFGLEKIKSIINKRYKYLTCVIITFIFLDLFSVNYPLLKSTFTIKPPEIKKHLEFQQRYRDFNLFPRESRSSMYAALLSNSGVINSYEVLNVKKGDVKVVGDADYKGEAYLNGAEGDIFISYFSPNKIVVNINVKEEGILVLNQNYYKGWKVIMDGQRNKADSFRGLISTLVTPGQHRVIFYYMPLSFLVGSFVSIFSILIFFLSIFKSFLHSK